MSEFLHSDEAIWLAVWMLFAYLVGSIPVGLLIGRIRGIDLRAIGSGNIGATNAVRALGKAWGLPVFFLDVLKAALPVWAARQAGSFDGHAMEALLLSLVGAAAFLGHIFSIYLRFAGGKGVACALGVFAVLCPAAAFASLVMYLQTLKLSRISAIGSLNGVSTMALFICLADEPLPYKVLVLVLGALIWWRHIDNLRQIFQHKRAAACEHDPSTETT